MRILGIETSCDETSAAVVENGILVRSCVIASSQRDFGDTGGVIPEYAARKQLECVLPVVDTALKQAGVTNADLDAIAVTHAPGLLGSLLVGTSTARTLCALWNLPLIPVHHTLGHLSSTWLDCSNEPVFPVLTLSVSGGHTDLWYRTAHCTGALAATTVDDAAGEAFDKGAVLLGLGYPGGPQLSALAKKGKRDAFTFPLPMATQAGFSFSGLKTSLKYALRDIGSPPDAQTAADLAASYQEAICSHLSHQLGLALEKLHSCAEVHIVGGVSANTRLREQAQEICGQYGVSMRTPTTLRYCTDNAAMIAAAGEFLVESDRRWLGCAFQTQATQSLASQLKME